MAAWKLSCFLRLPAPYLPCRIMKSFFIIPFGSSLYSLYKAFFLARSSSLSLFASSFFNVASLHRGALRGFLILFHLKYVLYELAYLQNVYFRILHHSVSPSSTFIFLLQNSLFSSSTFLSLLHHLASPCSTLQYCISLLYHL